MPEARHLGYLMILDSRVVAQSQVPKARRLARLAFELNVQEQFALTCFISRPKDPSVPTSGTFPANFLHAKSGVLFGAWHFC